MSERASGGTTADRVIALITESIGVRPDEVTLATELRDLGADSVDLVEVLYVFEERFRIELDVRSMDELRTVGDVVSLVERHVYPKL